MSNPETTIGGTAVWPCAVCGAPHMRGFECVPPDIELKPGWLDEAIKRANEGPPSHGWPLRRVFKTEKQ